MSGRVRKSAICGALCKGIFPAFSPSDEKFTNAKAQIVLLSGTPSLVNGLLFASRTSGDGGPIMMLTIKQVYRKVGTRICLSGEIQYPNFADLHAEIEEVGQPVALDLDEVDVVNIHIVRLLIENRICKCTIRALSS